MRHVEKVRSEDNVRRETKIIEDNRRQKNMRKTNNKIRTCIHKAFLNIEKLVGFGVVHDD